MAKKKTKSNPPSGLSLVRDGDKFILTWKIPSSKYGDGQQFNYKVDDEGEVITLDVADIYEIQSILGKRTLLVTEDDDEMPVLSLN